MEKSQNCYNTAAIKLLEKEEIDNEKFLKVIEALLTPQNFANTWDISPVTPKSHAFFVDYLLKHLDHINVTSLSFFQMKVFLDTKTDTNEKFSRLTSWIEAKVPLGEEADVLLEFIDPLKLKPEVLIKGLVALGEYSWRCIKLFAENATVFAVGHHDEKYDGYVLVTAEVLDAALCTKLSQYLEKYGGLLALENMTSNEYNDFVELSTPKLSFMFDGVLCCVSVNKGVNKGDIAILRNPFGNKICDVKNISLCKKGKETPDHFFALYVKR